MGKPTGFKDYQREMPERRPVAERIRDFNDIYLPFPDEKLKEQTARCMDCGVPTCHGGCPLGNLIPEWNELVYQNRRQEAAHRLHLTNNFPEFTGRLCPAPCEEACVLGINAPPVTIEQIEREIIETAFDRGWVVPEPPDLRTGKTVAVVGSGPAGLACAHQLNRAGHSVTVYERADRIGGLLRYGIPDFKLEKWVIDRRIDLMEKEGIRFETGVHVGADSARIPLERADAVVLCTGSTRPRDLPIAGRNLAGIHPAMDFLTLQNRWVAGYRDAEEALPPINAAGKQVVVIGGGDTGSDCIGTCHRQGALTIANLELLPRPTADRPPHQPWPFWPNRLRPSSSHEEGCNRHWGVLTKRFEGEDGHVTGVVTVQVHFEEQVQGPPKMIERAGTERRLPADLVLLALGFVGPENDTVLRQLGLNMTAGGTVQTDLNHMTSSPGVFAAGDARRGQSLIVWAISEGREAARAVDRYLTGRSALPAKGCCDLPRIP